MEGIPDNLLEQLRRFGQEHVLRWWPQLSTGERSQLLQRLQKLDLPLLDRLFRVRGRTAAVPSAERIGPISVIRAGGEDRGARAAGEAALRRGEVAVLVVAGGQGSRLGGSIPKGIYPIGPVSGRTLFEIHAAKVLALRRRYGAAVPFLIMTSEATDAETIDYFDRNQFFGLPADDVWFFRQGTMPALDLETGKLLMAAPSLPSTSPNGHGGTLQALVTTGLLDRLRQRGYKQLFYFQVDNPMTRIADPLFLGHHLAARADVSIKSVAKEAPTDKLGNIVLVDGRCSIIEYSDLPDALGNERDEQGRLKIWAGNTAIHWFAVDFLERLALDRTAIPYHIARKKVPYLDESGKLVTPSRENAIKFEMFIFDVLPLAERWTVMETTRAEEFAPLKNATGADSEAAVKQAISRQAADWLGAAGIEVPRSAEGLPSCPLEICPLFALDREELVRKVDRNLQVRGPLMLASGAV
jgi:UDP-N-acetylglucosamine/UDP-N-acetylgalactosamine diphosphorylase